MAITIVNNESELLAWIAARTAQATYTENETARIAAGVSITLSNGLQNSLDPVNAGPFEVAIEAEPAGSPFTGRFWYVPGIGRSELRLGAFTGLDLIRSKTKLRGLQIGRGTDAGTFRLGHGAQIEQCIMDTGATTGNPLIADVTGSGKVINSLLIRRNGGGRISGADGETEFIGCLLVNDGSTGEPLRSDYSGTRLIDTAIYGFDSVVFGTLAAGTTHNATSLGTAFGANCQTGLTSADFVSTAAGSEDYRRAPGSTKLGNTGTPNAALTIDFFGTSRPQGGTVDIGPHEVPEAGDTTPPVLTSASATAGTLTATGGVTSNEAGTLYWQVNGSATPLTYPATGAMTGWTSRAMTAGAQAWSLSSLAAGTYYLHLAADDLAGTPNRTAADLVVGPFTVIAGGPPPPPPPPPTVTVTLYQADGVTVAAPATGLRWAWFDQPRPDLFQAPTAKGSAGAIGAGGVLTVDITGTALGAGGAGWLEVASSDGNPASDFSGWGGPANRS